MWLPITVGGDAAHLLQLICTSVMTTLRSMSLPFDSVNRSSALYALQCVHGAGVMAATNMTQHHQLCRRHGGRMIPEGCVVQESLDHSLLSIHVPDGGQSANGFAD